MFAVGIILLVAGGGLLGAHYLGIASQIPGVAQIPAIQLVGAALAIAGAVVAVLFRRPSD